MMENISVITIVLAIIWYALGVGFFIYWWTSRHDFTTGEIPLALTCGFMGPITYIIGLLVYGSLYGDEKILIGRKKKK